MKLPAQVPRRAGPLRPAPDEPARDRGGQGGGAAVAADVHRVPGMNCTKICFPGKPMLSRRKGPREIIFS